MSTLAAERTRAATLDDQILALEHSLAALRAQRTLVQQRLDSYVYPVVTLPNEIVCEIFVHFLPVYPKCPPLSGLLSPMNLTHICRKWRDIALTTPTLWRAAYLSIDDPEGIEMDGGRYIPFFQQLHELDLWLSRSGCSPSSIEIEETCYSAERDFIVSAQCAHWEYLHVSLAYPPFFTIQGPMPSLRDLKLAVENYGSEDSELIVFPEAPLLRSATLIDKAVETVILPWIQLTSLTLDCVYPEECLPILQQTSNLVDCTLGLIDETGPWPNVTLPRLESLTLIPFHLENILSGYLETFIVPALQKLQISEKLDPFHSLTSFISKSGCKLQGIYIGGQRHVSQDAYCRAFPSIMLSFDEKFVGEGLDVAVDVEMHSVSEQ